MSRLVMCLAGVCIGLIVVGVLSNALSRHLIQIVPVVMVLAAAINRRKWVAFAAFPLFIFWLLIFHGFLSGCTFLKIATYNTRSFYNSGNLVDNNQWHLLRVWHRPIFSSSCPYHDRKTLFFIAWNLVVGFILIFFFNTLLHALPGYRRNMQLSLALCLSGWVLPCCCFFLGEALPYLKVAILWPCL